MNQDAATIIGNISRAAVLRALRSHGPMSVGDIVRATHMSQPTVTKWLARLEQDGYAERCGYGPSRGGRRPILYRLNPSAGYALGVEVEIPAVRLAVLDMLGSVSYLAKWNLDVTQDAHEILTALTTNTTRHLAQSGVDKARVWTCGVAFSGFVDQRRGLSVSTPRLKAWYDVPVQHHFQEALQLPVWMSHHIDGLALAEQALGAARTFHEFLYFDVGHGVGVRVVSESEPRGTPLGNAGLIGHTTVVPEGRECTCGNRGCLEMYASARAFWQRVEEIITERPHLPWAEAHGQGKLSARQVFAAAETDESVASLVDEFVYFLSIGIANAINVLGVTQVVVGGLPVHGGEMLRARLALEVTRRLQPLVAERTRLVFASLERDQAGPLGAGLYALQQYLDGAQLVPAEPR